MWPRKKNWEQLERQKRPGLFKKHDIKYIQEIKLSKMHKKRSLMQKKNKLVQIERKYF